MTRRKPGPVALKLLFAGSTVLLGCSLELDTPQALGAETVSETVSSLALRWSYAGPINGMSCTRVNEPSDPHAWQDNYLCSPTNLGLRWSYAGPIGGMTCTRVNEPADPHAWQDNYLCAPSNLGLRWSYAGPIAGQTCVQVNEPADPYAWSDNYLCYGATPVSTGESNPGGSGSTCSRWGTVWLGGNRYFYNNNIWNAPTNTQCADVNGWSFTITSATNQLYNSGPPAAYPSFVKGCHYGNCTAGHNMLRQVKDIPSVPTTFNVSTVPGKWNASYDIWFDPTPRTNGPNTGLELMIWVNYSDVQPIGSRVAQVALAGANWEVWFGNNGHSNVASYRRIGASNTNAFDIKSFMNDAQARGYLSSAWYLTSVQAGFEVWAGGTGLKVNSFSVAAK